MAHYTKFDVSSSSSSALPWPSQAWLIEPVNLVGPVRVGRQDQEGDGSESRAVPDNEELNRVHVRRDGGVLPRDTSSVLDAGQLADHLAKVIVSLPASWLASRGPTRASEPTNSHFPESWGLPA